MATIIDTIQRYRKIEDVTSSRDDAPPVYLMDEIADIVRSSPEASESVAEHVSRRLANKSPVVKWKVQIAPCYVSTLCNLIKLLTNITRCQALRLIRHLCNKGCSQFQKCMQRHSSAVRELTSYRGEQDPFKGDTLNQRVREAAKEAIEVLYLAVQQPVTAATANVQGRIQGFGNMMAPVSSTSSSHNIPTYTSSSSSSGIGSRMQGFGNTNYVPASNNANLSSSISSAVNQVGSNIGGFIRNQFPVRSEHASLHTRTGSNSSFTSGTTFGDSGYPMAMPVSAGVAGGVHLHTGNVLGTEEQLVEDLCAPGGLRAAPDPEDLCKFVEAASNMDGLLIAEHLMAKMNSTSWQTVLRALCALEAIVQQGLTQACGEVAVMFQSDPTPVRKALSSPQQSVRERAAKCMKLLVNEEHEVAAAPAKKPAVARAAAAAPVADLLVDDAEPAAAPAAAGAPAAASDPLDLLGDLTGSIPAVPAAVAADAGGLLGGEGLVAAAPVAAPKPAPQQQSNALFDLLGSPAAPAAAAAAAVLAVPAVPAAATMPSLLPQADAIKANVPLDDFFGSLSIAGTSQPVPAATFPSTTLTTPAFTNAPSNMSATASQYHMQQPQQLQQQQQQQASSSHNLLGNMNGSNLLGGSNFPGSGLLAGAPGPATSYYSASTAPSLGALVGASHTYQPASAGFATGGYVLPGGNVNVPGLGLMAGGVQQKPQQQPSWQLPQPTSQTNKSTMSALTRSGSNSDAAFDFVKSAFK